MSQRWCGCLGQLVWTNNMRRSILGLSPHRSFVVSMSESSTSPPPDSSSPAPELGSPSPLMTLHHICSRCKVRLYDSTTVRTIPCGQFKSSRLLMKLSLTSLLGEVLCEGCILVLLRDPAPKCPRCEVPITRAGVKRVFVDYVETPGDREIQAAVAE